MILHIHLFITLQDNSNMGDLITMLELLQKLENGKLIPEDQILKNTLEKSLSPGVYQILDNLLNQVDGNSTNPLYIDII